MEDIKNLSNQLEFLERYDKICQQLREEFSGEENEEDLSNKLNEAKMQLLVFLDPLQKRAQDNIERVYETVLYDALKNQLKRNYAYYRAMERYKEDERTFNNEVGAGVLEFDQNKAEMLLQKLDEIYFIRSIALGLELRPEEVDKIVDKIIDKNFTRKEAK